MTAQIIELSAYRAAHPDKAVSVRLVYDPLWMWRVWPVRVWLALWGVR